MTRDDVINVLSIAAAYDGRTLGESDVAAWGDAAERGRWTYDMAQDAVKAHYAESSEWIMPAHVTRRIRARRSEPPRSNALPQATPPRANDQHRSRVVAWFADGFRADREQRTGENRTCLTVECPHCGAEARQPCWQTAGNRVLQHKPPIEIPHRTRQQTYRDNKQE